MKRIITVETVQKTVIRRISAPPETVWCELCAAEVKMLSPAQAAQTVKMSQREIFRRVEGGKLHFTETADGKLLICSGSFSAKD